MKIFATQERTSIVQDGLLFQPIGEHAYKAYIETSYGNIEVMCCVPGTTDYSYPYEVWYPGDKESTPFQTADHIMNYILNR